MIGATIAMEEKEHGSAPSERDIIERVLRGSRDEFRHLMRLHQDKVYALILRQVGDPQVAQELAQDTFVKAYQKLSSFRFESEFSTWLIRIALNHSNSYFSSKKFKQGQRTVSLDMERYEQPAIEEENDEQYDKEAVERLRRAIGKLKPNFREVLVLCALEKKSYQEAATVLGIAVGTVRSRLNRARNQLQEVYLEV